MGRRKTIGRGRDKTRKNGWYIRVDGRKAYFPSRKQRDAAWSLKQSEVQAFGYGAAGSLSAHDRVATAEMMRRAGELGTTPTMLFNLGVERWHESRPSSLTVPEAVGLFCSHCDARTEAKTMRQPTSKGLKWMSRTFAAHVGTISIHAVAQRHVDAFAAIGKVTDQTRFNRVARLAMFFSWLVKKDHLGRSPIREKPRSPPRRIAVFDAATVEALLRKAVKDYPGLVPILALQWFAGMRPTATHGLRWEHIDFGRRRVVIPAELSKSTEPEFVDGLPDAVWEWLEPYRKTAGRITNGYHRVHYQALKRDCGIKRWPIDVARHTFASHLYGLTGSIETVARALLHHTTRITLKHYVAKGISQAAGGAYFSIRPLQPAQPPQ